MSGAVNIPLSMTSSGPQPTSIATLNSTIITNAEALAPGLTVLPGGLIEDQTSTGTAIAAVIDQARVDAVNSVTPYGANAFVLSQLGAMFGIPIGTANNGSVYVVFSGSVGYVIAPGFTVSDGTNQYVIQDGGAVGSNGQSSPLYAVCTASGIFAIPANTVTTIVSSVPSGYTLTVSNPLAGTPGTTPQTEESYRAQVLQNWSAPAVGMPNKLKQLLYAVPGVEQRLVSIQQVSTGFMVIVGGGDPYAVGQAIYAGTPDLNLLQSSSTSSQNVTVEIFENPDTYSVTFVTPIEQTVTVAAVWNTTQSNFTASATVNQQATKPLQSYINSLYVGEPINLLEMQSVFQNAVASILPSQLLTTLDFTITINGTTVSPASGTSIINGNSEGYFYCGPTGVSVVQG